jgi:hypothetical protein
MLFAKTLILLLMLNGLPMQAKVSVRLVLQSQNQTIKDKLISKIKSELRDKKYIEIKNDNAQFTITVNVVEIRSENSDVVGIVMSHILTKQTKSADNRFVDEILENGLNVTNSKEILDKCADIVARYDVNFFEKFSK